LTILKYIGFAGIIAFSGLVSSCENDLKDVEKISSKKFQLPVDKSFGVSLLYSDSAIVKANLITPELFYFHTKQPYYEMKKGVTIIFFDDKQKEDRRVTSDYGIWKENEKIVELRKNVVVINPKGETLKSDEVIWDMNKHRFFSNKMVTVVFANGSTFYGDGFWSDEDLFPYNLNHARGNMNVPEKQAF
jgi:LPS export ABC transporter protein LptC